MAVVLAAGFVLASRLGLRGQPGWGEGVIGYLLTAPIGVVLTGSALAAAGRSFRSGLWACAWAVLVAAAPPDPVGLAPGGPGRRRGFRSLC